LRTRRRAPGADARVGAGLQQIDCSTTAIFVLAAVCRHPFFGSTPAQFGRLHAFRDKAIHRPGIDENVERLRFRRTLRVALGDMDALDACVAHQARPAILVLRDVAAEAEIGGDIEKRLFHEPGNHARVRAAAVDRRDPARVLAAGGKNPFAQRIVRPRAGRHVVVEVKALPGLGDGIDVIGIEFAAKLDHGE
jgi:hypothetical protein